MHQEFHQFSFFPWLFSWSPSLPPICPASTAPYPFLGFWLGNSWSLGSLTWDRVSQHLTGKSGYMHAYLCLVFNPTNVRFTLYKMQAQTHKKKENWRKKWRQNRGVGNISKTRLHVFKPYLAGSRFSFLLICQFMPCSNYSRTFPSAELLHQFSLLASGVEPTQGATVYPALSALTLGRVCCQGLDLRTKMVREVSWDAVGKMRGKHFQWFTVDL